jgi:hypothetical protein
MHWSRKYDASNASNELYLMGKTEEHKAVAGIYFVTFVGMCIQDTVYFHVFVLFWPTQTKTNNQCENKTKIGKGNEMLCSPRATTTKRDRTAAVNSGDESPESLGQPLFSCLR